MRQPVDPIKVNLRVVAASNRDLAQEVRRGTFRQDLYFRLNVVSVTMPHLRERHEDIPLLTKHFLFTHSKKSARRVIGITDDATAALVAYDWPGNVRELENAIERAVVLGTTEPILRDDLPESIAEGANESRSNEPAKYHETIRNVKRQLADDEYVSSVAQHHEDPPAHDRKLLRSAESPRSTRRRRAPLTLQSCKIRLHLGRKAHRLLHTCSA